MKKTTTLATMSAVAAIAAMSDTGPRADAPPTRWQRPTYKGSAYSSRPSKKKRRRGRLWKDARGATLPRGGQKR